MPSPLHSPLARHQVGLRLHDRFYRLTISPDAIPDEPYEALDANVLQNVILSPVFGIDNPRKDDRLEFVADLPVSAPLLRSWWMVAAQRSRPWTQVPP